MRNNKKKNSKDWLVIIIVLMIIIDVALVVLLMRACGSEGSGTADGPEPPPASGETQPGGTEDPAEAPEEEEPGGEPETGTPEEEEPAEEPEEESSEEPAEEPEEETPEAVSSSGSFASDTGSGLNIVVDWHAVKEGEKATLTVTMSARSYSLHVSTIYGGASIAIGGDTYTLDTGPVSYDGSGLAVNALCSRTVELSMGGSETLDVDIFAIWNYGGTYSGVQFDNITALGTAHIG